MRIELRTNFSFPKLAGELSDILKQQAEVSGKGAAEGMRERIKKGLSPPLKDSTLSIRKLRGTGGSKPLIETGKLLKSIKGAKGGVKMLEYGTLQHEGFTPKKIPFIMGSLSGGSKGKEFIAFAHNKKNIKVPARPFIFLDKKSTKKAAKALVKMMNKALKSGIKIIK